MKGMVIIMPKKDNRLIIYEKVNKMIIYSKNLLIKYPKSERFDLCTDIKQTLYKILRETIYAWKINDLKERTRILNNIDLELIFLKSLVRISYEFKYITEKNFLVWSENIAEIGKMIGGWIKTCQKG